MQRAAPVGRTRVPKHAKYQEREMISKHPPTPVPTTRAEEVRRGRRSRGKEVDLQLRNHGLVCREGLPSALRVGGSPWAPLPG